MASVGTEGVILNPAAARASFSLERVAPSADLAPFVERHWLIRWDLRGRAPHRQETLPQPCVNLVFEAGRSGVFGVSTKRFEVVLEGQGRVVATKFKPGMFFPFVRRSMKELTGRAWSLAEAFGVDGLEAEVLAHARDEAAVGAIERFLRDRVPPPDQAAETVLRVVELAFARKAITTVEALAREAGTSVRTLQRLFARYVGVSPTWVVRRFRMHEAVERASQGVAVDWAALASDLGYYDQPHFIHDFKAQVGKSPAEYAALCAGAVEAPPRAG